MIFGVLLAAGSAQRFGADKLLEVRVGNEPMAGRCARRLAQAVDGGVAVVPPSAPGLTRACEHAGMMTVTNPSPERGMGASLALGVAQAPEAAAWVIGLADMPWIRIDTLRQVARALRAGHPLVVPCHGGRRGHPVGFGAEFGPALMALNGDAGGRVILQAHGKLIWELQVEDPGICRDVDTPEDARRWQRQYSP